MKDAPNTPTSTTLPKTAPGGLTAGPDWAKDDHVVCVIDTSGQVRDRFTVEHTSNGLKALIRKLHKLGCCEVVIERPDGPVVDALLTAQLTVVVISPNQVTNLRSRYGSAGNKDDRFDAYVLADTLRTDRPRLRAVGYCGRTSAEDLPARLAAAPRGLAGDDGLARAHITLAYLTTLRALREQITVLDRQISEQLAAHPDNNTFTSRPRSGTVRAARLLSEIGDCRARFPTPQSLACLAGVAPSTRQSGKQRAVGFRWACDKQLRDAVTDFAGDSRRVNPWADKLYRDAISRGHDHAHAVRILARAWLFVIWHCWQNGAAYDPQQHRALQQVLTEQDKIIKQVA